MVKDFIDTNDFTEEEIRAIVELAVALKLSVTKGSFYPHLLRDRSLGMIFWQASTRTRVSLEAAMTDLGGHGQHLGANSIESDDREALGDTARVLGSLLDIVAARVDRHRDIVALAAGSAAPVLNGMSDYNHPTQEITDLLTMCEHAPDGKRIDECKVAFIGDATQVCASLMFICSKMGAEFAQFGPKGHQITDGGLQTDSDIDLLAIGRRNCEASGGAIVLSDDLESIRGADFVYTDVWRGLAGDKLAPRDYLDVFCPKYQVTPDLMAVAGSTAKFMHCLPASRGEEVVNEVIDGPRSLCWAQAENHRHALRALLAAFGSRTPICDEIIDYNGKEELHRALDKIEVLQA